jgi:hypothetical protein
MIWKNIENEKPISYKTGCWDGKMSDEVLVYTRSRKYHVAVMYHVVMDGSETFEFYDTIDFKINNVTHWAEIDNPF